MIRGTNERGISDVELFVAYAADDADSWSKIEKSLSSLKQQGIISAWHEKKVENANDQVDSRMESSDAVVVLVSPHLKATKYFSSNEMHYATQRHESKRGCLIPIILSPVDLNDTSLDDVESLPSHPDAVESWQSIDDAFCDIANGIARIIERIHQNTIDLPAPSTRETIVVSSKSKSKFRSSGQSVSTSDVMPEHIGRFVVKRLLGKGAYGTVYLAHDEELDRHVAIKAPHPHRLQDAKDVEAYISEARLVASLEHPNIVPVYEVSRSQEGCHIVSRFIDGDDLHGTIRKRRLTHLESVKIVAQVAEALAYAHSRDIVHRDVKPANILIDSGGKPYLTDFGLAIKEDDFGKGAKYAGTPAFMSPEQARGEGHRVDGRSDIFSLGVVFYELISSKRPFRSKSISGLLEEISSTDARPPREIDARIPKELERICLKAMANRRKDRFTTAQDFADDLHFYLGESSRGGQIAFHSSDSLGNSTVKGLESDDKSIGTTPRGASTTEADETTASVIPKGLRSFDAEDACFFLRLLPGPYDRDGLPDSVRFWKQRIEATTGDRSFSVGLLYGPSGCGKTSMMKAALLPRVSKSVLRVFVSALGDNLEQRLRKKILECCPTLSLDLGLTDILTAIRRGRALPNHNTLLIVIDQFEQWLHGRAYDETSELMLALRQCDGQNVKCLLMVRDDYVTGIHRFMNQLEISIDEDNNWRKVDLFEQPHARDVLVEFGRSFKRLPEDGEISGEQRTFVERAVDELSDDNKRVVPIQLSIFAEMVKGRDWSDSTWKELGGATGIGMKFLEDTFDPENASLEIRTHQQAARMLLKELLPGPGSNIRGSGKSVAKLREACGYSQRPSDFAKLVSILDQKLRLITPAGSGQQADAANEDSESKGYELTHDYFVPILRDWLSRKQKETMRGRAELRLEERAVIWNSKPERRHLPSLLEFMNIRFLTPSTKWTQPQKRMMRKAAAHHTRRVGITALLLILAVLTTNSVGRRAKASRLVDSLMTADLAEVPKIRDQMESYRSLVEPELRKVLENPDATETETLNAQIVMLGADDGDDHVDPVFDHMLQLAQPADVSILREVLFVKKDKKNDELWNVVSRPEDHPANERLRAAAALAAYEPMSEKWSEKVLDDVALQLVSVPPSFVGQWEQNLKPVGDKLIKPLQKIYRDTSQLGKIRTTAASLLAQFTVDKPAAWSALLVDAANREQFDLFIGKLQKHEAAAIVELDRNLAELMNKIDELKDRFDHDLRTIEEKRDDINESLLVLQGEFVAFKESTPEGHVQPFEKRASILRERTIALENERSSARPNLLGNDDQRDVLARQATRIAVAFLRMSQGNKVWPLLKQASDSRLRSNLIHDIGPFGVKAGVILDYLKSLGLKSDEDSIAIRSALLMCLGEYLPDQLAKTDFKSREAELMLLLRESFEDPNPGVHAAAKWLLQKLGQSDWVRNTTEKLSERKRASRMRWYVNSQQQTIVILPPDENGFLMGSPFSEYGRERGLETSLGGWENRHLRRINRVVAMSSTEVTVAQYDRFIRDANYPKAASADYAKDVSPEADCPINYVKWIEAVQYCNWLSKQDGITENEYCYNIELTPEGSITVGLPEDYLQRSGYRLPTGSEWEYAARAGSTTSRHYGESEDLLGKYAWYGDNSNGSRTLVVGSLKPNHWGLFDVYGNVSELCHDLGVSFEFRSRSVPSDDIEQSGPMLLVQPTDLRIHRGGGYTYVPSLVRSASRDSSRPGYGHHALGFRVARTMPDHVD